MLKIKTAIFAAKNIKLITLIAVTAVKNIPKVDYVPQTCPEHKSTT